MLRSTGGLAGSVDAYATAVAVEGPQAVLWLGAEPTDTGPGSGAVRLLDAGIEARASAAASCPEAVVIGLAETALLAEPGLLVADLAARAGMVGPALVPAYLLYAYAAAVAVEWSPAALGLGAEPLHTGSGSRAVSVLQAWVHADAVMAAPLSEAVDVSCAPPLLHAFPGGHADLVTRAGALRTTVLALAFSFTFSFTLTFPFPLSLSLAFSLSLSLAFSLSLSLTFTLSFASSAFAGFPARSVVLADLRTGQAIVAVAEPTFSGLAGAFVPSSVLSAATKEQEGEASEEKAQGRSVAMHGVLYVQSSLNTGKSTSDKAHRTGRAMRTTWDRSAERGTVSDERAEKQRIAA